MTALTGYWVDGNGVTHEIPVQVDQHGKLVVAAMALVADAQVALPAQLTTVTFTAPVTPDYALQALTDTAPFGFKTHDEGATLLAVVANLQARLADLETKLTTIGVLAARV
jgi:hypothetical protein